MYAELSERLIKALRLKTSPVTVALSTRPPEGVERFEGEQKFCELIDVARFEDRVFYATVDNLTCKNGNYYLGLSEPFEGLTTGDHNSACEGGSGLVYSPAAFRRLLSGYEIMPTGTVDYVSYAPLAKTPFSETLGGMVVVIFCNPKQALFLQRGVNYKSGEIMPGLTGPSTCSNVIAAPLLTGKAHYSLGCFGLREFTEITSDEVIIGIPWWILSDTVDNLEEFLASRPDLDELLAQV